MNPMIAALAAQWRTEAELFRRRGLNREAEMVDSFALEIESGWRQWWLEPLPLEAAVAESNYSYSALQKQIADGTLQNVGTKGHPQVRRGDLPRKPAPKPSGLAERARAKRLA